MRPGAPLAALGPSCSLCRTVGPSSFPPLDSALISSGDCHEPQNGPVSHFTGQKAGFWMGNQRQSLPNVPYRQGDDWPAYARQVLGWNWLTWLLNFADRGLIGPLLPLIITAFGISYGEAGGIVSLFFVGYLSTFAGGLLSDRFGRKKLSTVSVFGYGAATCVTAAAPGVGFLAGVRIATGVFEGLQYPAAAAWVSESYPYHRRGRALAIWETGYSLGTLLGTLLATVLGAAYGWRAPWLVSGGLSIAAGVLFAKFVRERPRTQTPGYDEAMA